MTPEINNIFKGLGHDGSGVAGGMGAGLGAGLLGGVLGGALLNRRGGLFGGDGDGASAVNAINMNTDSVVAASERLTAARFDAEAQREIQASIERTAAATQLAVSTGNAALGVSMVKGQGETNTQVALTTGNLGTQAALNAAATQTLVQKIAGDLSTQVALNTAAVATAVERTGTATALAFKDAAIQTQQVQYTLAQAVKADGDLTRGLLIAQNETTLNRLLTTAQNKIIELEGDRNSERHSREAGVKVEQTVNTNVAQAQAQAQQQQIAQLTGLVSSLANQVNVMHQGIVQIGTGNAAIPTSTQTNVR